MFFLTRFPNIAFNMSEELHDPALPYTPVQTGDSPSSAPILCPQKRQRGAFEPADPGENSCDGEGDIKERWRLTTVETGKFLECILKAQKKQDIHTTFIRSNSNNSG